VGRHYDWKVLTSVSLIIPVFNACATIEQTLASIEKEINANPNIDWQIIAVDDGSTDGSVKILQDWETKLPLSIVELAHSGSPAGPRNHGIEAATSDYVFFLDADDVLLSGGLSAAVSYALENDSEVVLVKLKSLDGRGVPRGMFSGNQPKVTLADSRIYWALNPMKLVKRSLLIKNQIRFVTDLAVGEDQPFSAMCYLYANNVSILSAPPVVGVRYTKSCSNMTLQVKPAAAYFALLDQMSDLLDSANLDTSAKNFLWMRHWEIEIAREFIWNSMPITSGAHDIDLKKLHRLSLQNLVPDMLPKISIRWRGIVGLIATSKYTELEKLLFGRNLVLENKSIIKKIRGIYVSNWVRLTATLRLPKNF
jgi:glycosyltransferase involved in cell wall biosynthesis